MKIYLVLGSGVATGMLAAQGCDTKTIDPLHCAVNDGDAYCARQFDDDIERFCQRGIDECYTSDSQYGCVEQRPTNACYSPCGGRQNIDENGECVMMEDSSTSSSSSEGTETEPSTGSSSESSSTTGPMPCTSNDECTDVATPYCADSGVCVPCDQAPMPVDADAACSIAAPALPVCSDGTCVQCTPESSAACTETTPICDGATNTCVPCIAHDQCGSDACELGVGRCFPQDFVMRVDGDEVAMPPMLFETVADAVAAVPSGMHGVIIVHELDGGAAYQGSVTIDAGKTIALLAAPGENPIIQGTGGNPGLSVQGAATILYMEGLRVAGNTMGRGLSVNDAFAWLDRCRIVQNTGGGILAEAGAELTVRNCFIGGSVDDVNALEVDSATANILYSTVGAGTTTAVGLACTTPVSVVVRNSLIVSRGLDVTGGYDVVCDEAQVTYSATESNVAGVGNQAVGEMDNTMPQLWFVGYGTGDFHLQNDSPDLFADVAQWNTGDPPTDIDGDLRTAVAGDPDYAGADVPM